MLPYSSREEEASVSRWSFNDLHAPSTLKDGSCSFRRPSADKESLTLSPALNTTRVYKTISVIFHSFSAAVLRERPGTRERREVLIPSDLGPKSQNDVSLNGSD